MGKTAVARALMKRTERPTVLVELDYYRFSFVNPPSRDHGLEYEMSGSDALIALNLGFDVVFDRNFTAEDPDPFLDRLFSARPRENYLFYLDATSRETLKRHATKLNPRIPPKCRSRDYRFHRIRVPLREA